MEFVNILAVPVAAVDLEQAAQQVERWIRDSTPSYVTVTGVHGIMASRDDAKVLRVHQRAAMCVPDGMPTVWIGRLRGHRQMHRVYGPDLMLELFRRSEAQGFTHFLYGGGEGVADRLRDRLLERFPRARVVGTWCPPFRACTDAEEADLRARVAEAKPDLLWVGLSTPKQEMWMEAHLRPLQAKVMIGVGAAFDFHAGLLRQAPRWVQKIGMEWFFRLCREPKRLWKRYLFNNPRFVYQAGLQLLGLRRYPIPEKDNV